MLDSGASTNIMNLRVMRQLGLEITMPYGSVYGIDSNVVSAYGLIENLEGLLERYPKIVFVMDIVVVDILEIQGMILYRKWAATLGGTLQMNLYYATIPMGNEAHIILYNKPRKRSHVEYFDSDLEMIAP